MRDYLIKFWYGRFNMARVSNEYLKGYAHALRDADIVTEQDEREMLQQLCERVNPN